MLTIDGLLPSDNMPGLLEQPLPEEFFRGRIGFFENFPLWELDVEAWLKGRPTTFRRRMERTGLRLHLLCSMEGESDPGPPAGHLLSLEDEGGRSIEEIHPYSTLSWSLNAWLDSDAFQEGEGHAQLIRLGGWEVYLMVVGARTWPGEGELGVLLPGLAWILHGRATFGIASGTPVGGEPPRGVLSRLHELLGDNRPPQAFSWSNDDEPEPGGEGQGGNPEGGGAGGAGVIDAGADELPDAFETLTEEMSTLWQLAEGEFGATEG